MSVSTIDETTMFKVLRALRYRRQQALLDDGGAHPWLDLQVVTDRLKASGAAEESSLSERIEALQSLLAALLQRAIADAWSSELPEDWRRQWRLLDAEGSERKEALVVMQARFFSDDLPSMGTICKALGISGSTGERRQALGVQILTGRLRAREAAARLATTAAASATESDASAAPAAAATSRRPQATPGLRVHLERCLAEWQASGLDSAGAAVALKVLVNRETDALPSQDGRAQEPFSGDLQALLDADSSPAFVLLGPPGSGKTTLLRVLERSFAASRLADVSAGAIPFFVSLAQYGSGSDPLAWLEATWRRRAPDLPPLIDLLAGRRLLLLADGLNEMPHRDDDGFRSLLRGWKQLLRSDFAERGGNRVIFTCRSLDYSASLSTAELPVPQVLVEPLDDGAVRDFLKQHGIADAVDDALAPELKAVLRRPLMLRLLAGQAAEAGALPRGRVGLISGFIRQVLRRELERDHPLLVTGPWFSARDLKRVALVRSWARPHDLPDEGRWVSSLQRLAWTLQGRQASADGSQVHAPREELKRLLADVPLDELLALGGSLGLLTEDLERDEVAFAHQLFQEYFAARTLAAEPAPHLVLQPWKVEEVHPSLAHCLADLSPAEPLPPLAGTGWEEITLMAAPMSDAPEGFVASLIEVNLPLAGRALLQPEMPPCPELRLRLQRELAERACDRGADLRARLAAGEVLGRLGDPRFARGESDVGAHLLPPWVRVPGGEYTLPGLQGYPEPTRVSIGTIHMGQFPVTNAEYLCFMQAEGYREERWWPEGVARKWFEGHGTNSVTRRQTMDWCQKFRNEPDLFRHFIAQGLLSDVLIEHWQRLLAMDLAELEVHLERTHPDAKPLAPRYWRGSGQEPPNHPVAGICWFEADAYCRWLAAATGLQIRLPSQEERWVAGLPADEFKRDTPEGNTLEAHLRNTCPTGVFSWSGKWGDLFDFMGNVGEWGMDTESAGSCEVFKESMIDKPATRPRLSGGWPDPVGSEYQVHRLQADLRVRDTGFRIVWAES